MITRYLDIGCGPCPRNPYHCDEVFAVDLALPAGISSSQFVQANLSLEPIPFPDSSFDSVSAFDFLEHVPRVLQTSDGSGTRFPFVELMNEIHRVLKRRFNRWHHERMSRLSHLVWEFSCSKPAP